MEFLTQYSLFLLKSITLVVSLLLAVAGILALSRKQKPKLEITPLNKDYSTLQSQMNEEIKGTKKDKKKIKQEKKQAKNRPCLYVIEFNGDIKASQVEQLRDEITAILSVVDKKDEIMVKVESPGGSVNGYGLAASQLQRIRSRHIPLTVCIDKIAASGGYLMACVANHIVAAPFSIIGSIGVVAQFPNFHRFLKKNDIDVELVTAGEYKRTLTLFSENTEKGRKKFQEDLENIHQAFRDYVLTNRQQLDIDKISTGEHWLASDAYDLKLIDSLQTSDDWILEKMTHFNVFQISIYIKPPFIDRLLKPAMKLLHPWA
ncbi:MAG: protease SohB [Legionellales bacterium RIFCSPHIGHO2_12_FULL_42_9]|nr:MAG: protease SohB [Legionellales bacterium RIFCSPHIGHO2_12_FULL_42_9]